MKVFLDTNIWFSAFYGSDNCRKIIELHAQKKIEVVVSRLVVRELTQNLGSKYPKGLKLVADFFSKFPPEMEDDCFEIDRKLKNLADLKDLPILLSAYSAKVEYFVTGNIKDFAVKNIFDKLKIKVITPKDFVKLFHL
ncbi:MAG: putative toxin-antitoxin system toxin component, PIN family [Patescibacteria group bacterium]